MSEQLGFAHFLHNADAVAWIVLALLIGMSIGSWYLIAAKGLQSLMLRRRSRAFLGMFWQASDVEAVAQRLDASGAHDPYSRLVRQAFDAIEGHRARDASARLVDAGTIEDFLTRTLQRAIAHELTRLERGQTFLATVASTAPFVGLFGTVWGIYHALMAIGASGNAGLDAVAAPVGEALIMTGIGLAVAIPAAVAYNAFVRVRRNARIDLESFAHDLFAFLGTGAAAPKLAEMRERRERRESGGGGERMFRRMPESTGAAAPAGGR